MESSLAAEALLLSIDPASGGLFVTRRRRQRFRKGLAAARGSYRAALDELRDAGLVHGSSRRPVLTDRAPAAVRFREIQDAIRKDTLREPRDIELFALLAWTGVLARRLPRDERRVAAWRLRRLGRMLVDAPAARGSARPTADVATIFPVILALGATAGGDGRQDIDTSGLLDGSGLSVGDGGSFGGGGGDFSYGGGDFGGGDAGGGGNP